MKKGKGSLKIEKKTLIRKREKRELYEGFYRGVSRGDRELSKRSIR